MGNPHLGHIDNSGLWIHIHFGHMSGEAIGGRCANGTAAMDDSSILSALELDKEVRVHRLDSRLWGSNAHAIQKVNALSGRTGAGGDADHSIEEMVKAWSEIVSEDAVIHITLDPGRRATIKVLSSVLQCIEAACEQLDEEAGTVLAVLQGWEKEALEGTSIWTPGESHLFEVEALE